MDGTGKRLKLTIMMAMHVLKGEGRRRGFEDKKLERLQLSRDVYQADRAWICIV